MATVFTRVSPWTVRGLALGLAVLAASLWVSQLPHGGISQADAIEAATDFETSFPGSPPVTLISAELRHDFSVPDYDVLQSAWATGGRERAWAWIITFGGHWHLLCDSDLSPGCNPTEAWVAIDHSTGKAFAAGNGLASSP